MTICVGTRLQLNELAAKTGRGADEIVQDVVAGYVDEIPVDPRQLRIPPLVWRSMDRFQRLALAAAVEAFCDASYRLSSAGNPVLAESIAHLDCEVAARNHDAVGFGQDVVELVDGLRLLDLRDHARRRSVLANDRLEVPHIGGRAHERERDEVDAEREREVEVGKILLRQ